MTQGKPHGKTNSSCSAIGNFQSCHSEIHRGRKINCASDDSPYNFYGPEVNDGIGCLIDNHTDQLSLAETNPWPNRFSQRGF